MSEFFCRWRNFQNLVDQYRRAEQENDKLRMVDIKEKLHDLCQRCGEIPTEEIKKLISKYLPPEAFARAPFVITRMLEKGNANGASDYSEYITMFLKKIQPEPPKRFYYRISDFQKIGINEDGTERLIDNEPKERIARKEIPNPNLEEQRLESLLPDVCNANCPFARHCSAYPQNEGQPCVKKWKFKKTESHKLKEPNLRSTHNYRESNTPEVKSLLGKNWNVL